MVDPDTFTCTYKRIEIMNSYASYILGAFLLQIIFCLTFESVVVSVWYIYGPFHNVTKLLFDGQIPNVEIYQLYRNVLYFHVTVNIPYMLRTSHTDKLA